MSMDFRIVRCFVGVKKSVKRWRRWLRVFDIDFTKSLSDDGPMGVLVDLMLSYVDLNAPRNSPRYKGLCQVPINHAYQRAAIGHKLAMGRRKSEVIFIL